jgi:hypothetical protein
MILGQMSGTIERDGEGERAAMPIRRMHFTDHAELRRTSRDDVDRTLVEQTVLEPDQVLPDVTNLDRLVAQKLITLQGKPYLLRVFYDVSDEDPEQAEVVSYYYTSQVRRYWRTTT